MRGLRKRPFILLAAQRLLWAENRQENPSQTSTSGCWVTLKFSCWAKPQVLARMPPLVLAEGSILGAVLPEDAMQQPFPGMKHAHPIGWDPSNVAATLVRGINA